MRISIPNRWRGGFASDQAGALAVEFSLVGAVYVIFILSMFELGWTMTKVAVVDNAVGDVAKQIYIGAATGGSPTQKELSDFVCKRASIIKNCQKNIAIEVTPVTGFNALPSGAAACLDSENPKLKPKIKYDPGVGGQIMFLRVCVTTDVFTPMAGLSRALVKTKTNRMQIISSMAFMNEPF